MDEIVSVIIPVYNVEQYIEECLESIINQTYTVLDIIIINNGSSDLSGNICQKYANMDERVHYIVQENKGVSAARNMGLKFSKGQYVCFCDADDIYELNYVETMLATMKEVRVDLVICGYNLIVGKEKRNYSNIGDSQYLDQESLLENIFLNNNIGGFVWNKLFKRDLLNGVYFEENYQICEDTDFVFRYLENCKKTYVTTQRLYNYRSRCGSAVNNMSNLFDEDNQLKYAVVYEKLMKLDMLSEESKQYIKCGIYMLCVSSLCDYKNQAGDNEEIIAKLKSKIKQYKRTFMKSKKIRMKKKLVVVMNEYFNIRKLKKYFMSKR